MKDKFYSTLTYERISHLIFDEENVKLHHSFIDIGTDGKKKKGGKKTHEQYRVITVILRIEVWIKTKKKKKRKAKTNR